jgi:transcriptional regulator with XRE-family HTH domain
MTLRQRLGRNIVRAREERGWLQTDLARRLGISPGRLSKWEKGEHAPPLAGLADLGRVLETSLDVLVLGSVKGDAGALTLPQREKVREAVEALSALLLVEEEEDIHSEVKVPEACHE